MELNASKLFISEECVQNRVWILCIHVVLSHHILGFPWWRESITGICRQWVEKMASVDLSYSSFLHLQLLCSPISTLPPLLLLWHPYLPQSPYLSSPAGGLPLSRILFPPASNFSTLSAGPLPSLQFELQALPISSPAHVLGRLNPISLSSQTPPNYPQDSRWDLLPSCLTLSPTSQRNYSLTTLLYTLHTLESSSKLFALLPRITL